MIHRRRGQIYADSQADLQEVLHGYSVANSYPTEHYTDAVCVCGNRTFRLSLDDDAGAAIRQCYACDVIHGIADSDEYLSEATLEECECPCGADEFEITVRVALYVGSDDVKWLYVGCRCSGCHLAGCYGDWKNEYGHYRQLLAMV